MKNRKWYLGPVVLIVILLGVACAHEPIAEPTPEPAIAAEVPTPTPQPYQKYGVHIHPTWDLEYDKKQIDRAYEVGAEVIRIGPSWRLLEPSPGEWDEKWYLPALDELVEYSNSKGLKIFFMLAETPCWASSDLNKDCGRIEAYNKWCPAYDPRLYAIALGYLVERYRDGVWAWEVWNEPNMPQFWCKPNAAEYTAMLRASYNQAKAVDPNATVLGGSLAGADIEYLEEMYAAGAKDFFDALALHPYSGTQPPDGCNDPRWSYQCGVEAVREVMLAHGDDKPIWFTEIGWSSFKDSGGVGEKQAEYLEQAFTIAQEWEYVPVIIWYDLIDDSQYHPDDREGYFGLFNLDLEPKPAAKAFQKFKANRE